MNEIKTDTSIYMYAFCDNWTNRAEIKKVKFDNLYLGDFEYQNYNFFQTSTDFEKFLDDSIIFATIREDQNLDFDSSIEILKNMKQCVTTYDISDYSYNSDNDEIIQTDFRKQMFVFEVSGKHENALREFKQSRYSKMYEPNTVNSIFSTHTDYYVKLNTPKGFITITESNVDKVFEGLCLEKEVSNIKISYAHVLKKSPQLKSLLEKIYMISISPEQELKSKLKWNKEIYNYEKVMTDFNLQQLIST